MVEAQYDSDDSDCDSDCSDCSSSSDSSDSSDVSIEYEFWEIFLQFVRVCEFTRFPFFCRIRLTQWMELAIQIINCWKLSKKMAQMTPTKTPERRTKMNERNVGCVTLLKDVTHNQSQRFSSIVLAVDGLVC